MKPKSIRREEILADTTLQSKKMSLETPIGTIESDSGNHYLDIFSIILVIGILYIGKKLVDKYIK
jgi:hypothetical protein